MKDTELRQAIEKAFRLGAKAATWQIKREGEPQPKEIQIDQLCLEWIDDLIEINEDSLNEITEGYERH